jgi:hypothetical protein
MIVVASEDEFDLNNCLAGGGWWDYTWDCFKACKLVIIDEACLMFSTSECALLSSLVLS